MVTLINTLLVKPGQMDEFISQQRRFAVSICDRLPGLGGGRMYRNAEGSKAVLVSLFESAEAQAAIQRDAEFQAHLEKMRGMVEASNPDLYAEAYTYGAFK